MTDHRHVAPYKPHLDRAQVFVGVVHNAVVLMFVRGWQGGTIHQIAAELGVEVSDIVTADADRMGVLMRDAQAKCRAEMLKRYADKNDGDRFDPRTAIGKDLDALAKIAGSRKREPGMTDDTMRKSLLSYIRVNTGKDFA